MSKWDSVLISSSGYFIEVQRIHASVRIMLRVVSPDKFEQFIKYVLDHIKIDMKYKLIVCLELMSGSRISEILRLRKGDIVVKGDRVGIRIGVSKKRRSKERMLHRFGSLSPRVGMLLLKYVEGLRDEDLIFNLSRIKVWTMYRRMFDICPHALRHSFIIYCFEKRGMKIEEVVNKMLFSNMEMAMRYYNSRLELEDFDEFRDL